MLVAYEGVQGHHTSQVWWYECTRNHSEHQSVVVLVVGSCALQRVPSGWSFCSHGVPCNLPPVHSVLFRIVPSILCWCILRFSIKKFIRGQTNADLFLTDERVAIALCFPEVCESFCMLFGSIWRLLKTDNSFFYVYTYIYHNPAQQPRLDSACG